MASKKPTPQEMVQIPPSEYSSRVAGDLHSHASRSRSSSPFWRSKPSISPQPAAKARTPDPNVVVGASYSYADMLNFSSLSLSSSGRPRTPPSLRGARSTGTPPPHRPNVTSTLSGDRSDPTAGRTGDAFDWSIRDEEEGSDPHLDFNDEEDEFGLPTVSTARKANKRTTRSGSGGKSDSKSKIQYPSTVISPTSKSLQEVSDISEIRGGPLYPSTTSTDGKILRPQYKDILKDPASSLHLISHAPLPQDAGPKETEAHSTRISRINKFKRILHATSISLSDLRNCAWSGVPQEVRSMTWQVLLGYLPTSAERRASTLDRKRKEYLEGIRQAFEKSTSGLITPVSGRSKSAYSQGRTRGLDENVWHQISIDVPRTSPHIELYGYEATQRSLERILYLWAIRHPASGYVQGINDLVTPFWQVFLGTYISDYDIERGMDPGQLPRSVIDAVEADSYWCLTKLLDGIQDNYIYAQPGIVRQVSALKDLTSRIDGGLAKHLENEGVEFMQFSFRWMNCLLMREVNVRCTIRMWDTYLAEEQGFSEFHLYVCAAFLVKWTERLVKMEFQEIMMFLQALPTKDWNEKDVELLLSEAFIWQSLFKGSSAHLRNGQTGPTT